MSGSIEYKCLAVPKQGLPVQKITRVISLDQLKGNELVVKIKYSTLNRMDPMLQMHNPPYSGLGEPYVLGFDYAGIVHALPAAISDTTDQSIGEGQRKKLAVGDRICGRGRRGGGFGEYLLADASEVELIDTIAPSIDLKDAACIGIAFITAYESLIISGHIDEDRDKWIFIAGAGGGLGQFAVQFAKIFGLKVIGSAGKRASVELLEKLQVDKIVDYSTQDVVEEVMKFTQGKGVDVVYDSTCTKTSLEQSYRVVAKGGKYIRLLTEKGVKAFNLPDHTAEVVANGSRMIAADAARYDTEPDFIPQKWKLYEAVRQGLRWCDEGKLKPAITQVIPFEADALQQALTSFMKGEINVGKVVVKVSE